MNRNETAVKIRERVTEKVGGWLSEGECLKIAVLLSLFCREEVLGFAMPAHVSKAVLPHADSLKMTPVEFESLFAPAKTLAVVEPKHASAKRVFAQSCQQLQQALRVTVGEQGHSKSWSVAGIRTAALVALHGEDHETLLGHALGGIVRSDFRRLDELKCSVEDAGIDSMLVVDCVDRLVEAMATVPR